MSAIGFVELNSIAKGYEVADTALKTSNIKPSIQSYRFENGNLYIILKAGQGSEIPAVRVDDLMKLISDGTIFDIKRLRFFDENLMEL